MSMAARAQPGAERGAAAQGPQAGAGVDVSVLTRDHALASTPEGRELVEWLAAHAVDAGEWAAFVAAVPAAQVGDVAAAARACARVWVDFAEALERRPAAQWSEPTP